MPLRRDDIDAFIAAIDGDTSGKKLRTWTGAVAVDIREVSVPENVENWGGLEVALRNRTDRWIIFDVSYHARGANANDAERVFSRVFEVTKDRIAIDSREVIHDFS